MSVTHNTDVLTAAITLLRAPEGLNRAAVVEDGVAKFLTREQVADLLEKNSCAQADDITLIADGQRFRRALSLLLQAFIHEALQDAGPHPVLQRLKDLAEPLFVDLEDMEDSVAAMGKAPAIVRQLLDQLHAEGLLP